MDAIEQLDKIINIGKEKYVNKCVTASDLIKEHSEYCKYEEVCKCNISCTECFAIFAIDNFNIERK